MNGNGTVALAIFK